MWQIERHGHVVMGRVVRFEDDADAANYCLEWRRQAAAVDGKFVVCADYRLVPVFSPAAAEELKQLMTALNDRIERSAMLVDRRHATNAMQVARLARETHNEQRRRFDELPAMMGWLAEVCDADERAAIEAFLGVTRR
jgi:hypothetical protein